MRFMALSAALRRPLNGLPDGDHAVYALVDPTDETIRYVGKTNDDDRRSADHAKAPANVFVARWRALLARTGHKPRFVVLQGATAGSVLSCERDWLWWITSSHNLLNIRHGQLPERGRAPRKISLAITR